LAETNNNTKLTGDNMQANGVMNAGTLRLTSKEKTEIQASNEGAV
jgi:hypothetical protein